MALGGTHPRDAMGQGVASADATLQAVSEKGEFFLLLEAFSTKEVLR